MAHKKPLIPDDDNPRCLRQMGNGDTIDPALLPSLSKIDDLGIVAGEEQMLALVGERGDWCTRTDDETVAYMIIGDDPTKLSSWTRWPYPTPDLSSCEKTANKNQASGYAGLDATTHLDGDQLPAMSSGKKGGVPATGSPSNKYLRDDASWQSLPPPIVNHNDLSGIQGGGTGDYYHLTGTQAGYVTGKAFPDLNVTGDLAGTSPRLANMMWGTAAVETIDTTNLPVGTIYMRLNA